MPNKHTTALVTEHEIPSQEMWTLTKQRALQTLTTKPLLKPRTAVSTHPVNAVSSSRNASDRDLNDLNFFSALELGSCLGLDLAVQLKWQWKHEPQLKVTINITQEYWHPVQEKSALPMSTGCWARQLSGAGYRRLSHQESRFQQPPLLTELWATILDKSCCLASSHFRSHDTLPPLPPPPSVVFPLSTMSLAVSSNGNNIEQRGGGALSPPPSAQCCLPLSTMSLSVCSNRNNIERRGE